MKEKTFGQKQNLIMTFDKKSSYQDIIKEAEKLQSKYCSHLIVIDFVNGEFLAEGKESLHIDNEKETVEILETSNDVDFSSWRKSKDINKDAYKKNLLSQLKKVGV